MKTLVLALTVALTCGCLRQIKPSKDECNANCPSGGYVENNTCMCFNPTVPVKE